MAKSIIVEDLGKKFDITPHDDQSLRTNLQRAVKLRFSKKTAFWALRHISFDVEEGEVFGFIGANGSGKSTLLKILSKIVVPTEGRVELRGKVNSLLEVGTGFHPELTGRENIFLNGSILGLKRAEIRSKFDAIVDFSEIGAFLDTPVKWYSSGMYVRLAFSVAAHLDPDILIVDEVLSVGDQSFQRKCIEKMEVEVFQGRSVLLVSHNLEVVRRLCDRVMLLDQGSCKQVGAKDLIVDDYVRNVEPILQTDFTNPKHRKGTGKVRVTSLSLMHAGKTATSFSSGHDITFRVQYESELRSLRGLEIRIVIKSYADQVVFAMSSNTMIASISPLPGNGMAHCSISRLPLNVGLYHVDLELYQAATLVDRVPGVHQFEVTKGDFYKSGILPDTKFINLVDHSWLIDQA
ncbi:UNVERIFIED_CONTAM: hypothetical protein GTU68_015042 [Idotea baltica]|nr:hypothetical protein [Idotea baltica]